MSQHSSLYSSSSKQKLVVYNGQWITTSKRAGILAAQTKRANTVVFNGVAMNAHQAAGFKAAATRRKTAPSNIQPASNSRAKATTKQNLTEDDQIRLVIKSWTNIKKIQNPTLLTKIVAVAMDVRAVDHMDGQIGDLVQTIVIRKQSSYINKFEAVSEAAVLSKIGSDVSLFNMVESPSESFIAAAVQKFEKENASFFNVIYSKGPNYIAPIRYNRCLAVWENPDFTKHLNNAQKASFVDASRHLALNLSGDVGLKATIAIFDTINSYEDFDEIVLNRSVDEQKYLAEQFSSFSTNNEIKVYLALKYCGH